MHVFENYWRVCIFFFHTKNAKPPHATSGYFWQTHFFWRKWLCDRCFFLGVQCGPSFIITTPFASEAVCELFAARGAASMSICTLLDKKALLQQKQTRKRRKGGTPAYRFYRLTCQWKITIINRGHIDSNGWNFLASHVSDFGGGASWAKTWKLLCYIPVFGVSNVTFRAVKWWSSTYFRKGGQTSLGPRSRIPADHPYRHVWRCRFSGILSRLVGTSWACYYTISSRSTLIIFAIPGDNIMVHWCCETSAVFF